MRRIQCEGYIFTSIKEFTTAYNLPYQQTVNKLKNGYTADQIVSENNRTSGRQGVSYVSFEYKGKYYPSLSNFCQEHNLKYSRIYFLKNKGMSIEDILEHEGIVLSDDVEEGEDSFYKDGLYVISKMTAGIRKVFEDNPYCVLGISCRSSRMEALNQRDKLEKLDRLGASGTYSSKFDLHGVEKPNRELGHIQIVLNNLGKIEYRWMWYLTSEYVDSWNSETLFESHKTETNEYDFFLACLQQGLIVDPLFSDTKKWNTIFNITESIYALDDAVLYKILSKRLTEDDRKKYNYRMVVNNFRDVIRNSIVSTMEAADGNALLNICLLLSDNRKGIKKELRENLDTWVLRWIDRILVNIKDFLKNIQSIKKLNQAGAAEASEMYSYLDLLAKRDFAAAEKLSQKLDSFHGEMMMDKIKETVYDATIVLAAGGRKRDACRFDSMIYIYCTDVQKKEIKRVYPAEWLEIPESEFTVEECRSIAANFEAKKDWTNGFIWMMRAAKKGDAASQNDVGVYYALGRGRKEDQAEAFYWYEKAAEGGNAVAYGNLAYRYYDGVLPCKKDKEKAKKYWITAYKINRSGGFDKKLDEYFPKWRKEEHPLLTFSEDDWEYIIRPYAEDGIVDAEYWYAVLLYKGINGCIKDTEKARRWFLKAAIYDHPSAIRDLKIYYKIDAQELSDINKMFSRGCDLRKSKIKQDQDLAFYWLFKVSINGHDDMDNLIGLCYYNGIGVDQNYEIACEYYLKSIEKKNNIGALYNYGLSLFLGHGVKEDKEKAKEFFLKAKANGSKAAENFLLEKYGIGDGYKQFEYEDFSDIILHNKKIIIQFCGIKTESNKAILKFWINNTDAASHSFWIKNVKQNGNLVENITKIGNCDSQASSYFTKEFNIIQKEDIDYIEFSIEVDNEGTIELFTLDTVKLTLFNRVHLLSYEIICGTGSNLEADNSYESAEEPDEEDAEQDYAFADDDFDDLLIYEDNGLRIEFGGFTVEDEKVYATIWSKNTSKKNYHLLAKDIVIDDTRVCENAEVITSEPGDSWIYTGLFLEGVGLDIYYDVEFTIEIKDENNSVSAFSKRVKCRIDFSRKEISAELSEHVNYDEDDEDDVTDNNAESQPDNDTEEGDRFGLNKYLYVANSYCMTNEKHNGLEIYFPSIPSEFVRATLKEEGWHWHREKKCWYARDTYSGRKLAKNITGHNVWG